MNSLSSAWPVWCPQEVRISEPSESTASTPATTEGVEEEEPPHGVPTLRPRRVNCTPPAIEQFPNPLLGPSFRKHGGLLFHILVCVYSFVGLAIVCDDYFVTSLDRICEGNYCVCRGSTRWTHNWRIQHWNNKNEDTFIVPQVKPQALSFIFFNSLRLTSLFC